MLKCMIESRMNVFVRFINTHMIQRITGEPPPKTKVNAGEYAEWNVPWFPHYEEKVAPSNLGSPLLTTPIKTEKNKSKLNKDDVGFPFRESIESSSSCNKKSQGYAILILILIPSISTCVIFVL
eukprot:TRINITY_DN1480_c0_g3_i2.p1 TRINITY_DN1480_c0_g3~~TRINITY_DN1480_c0_g3_i2.p1  ORF type:complete len:124 (+),score=14.37 TRINITY_DN1480_c0_g3_i2:515-886(+)